MKIGETKHIKISYRADMQTAIIRWQQPVTFTEFKLNCLGILAMAKENSAVSWLMDCRSKGEICEQESEWLCNEFYPKVRAQVSSTMLIGWLLNPRQMQRLNEGEMLKAIYSSDPDVRREAFLTEQEAVTWLERSVTQIILNSNPS